jgi:hypothetical protein
MGWANHPCFKPNPNFFCVFFFLPLGVTKPPLRAMGVVRPPPNRSYGGSATPLAKMGVAGHLYIYILIFKFNIYIF